MLFPAVVVVVVVVVYHSYHFYPCLFICSFLCPTWICGSANQGWITQLLIKVAKVKILSLEHSGWNCQCLYQPLPAMFAILIPFTFVQCADLDKFQDPTPSGIDIYRFLESLLFRAFFGQAMRETNHMGSWQEMLGNCGMCQLGSLETWYLIHRFIRRAGGRAQPSTRLR